MTPEIEEKLIQQSRMDRDPNGSVQKSTKGWKKLTTDDGIVVSYGGSPERQKQTAKDEAEAKERAKARREAKKDQPKRPRRKK